MDSKTLKRYMKLLAKEQHASTPEAERKTTRKIRIRMEKKHPDLPGAAEAFKQAQEQASSTGVDWTDPDAINQAWADLVAALGGKADAQDDTWLGRIKAMGFRWAQEQGKEWAERHAGILLEVLEAELQAAGAEEPLVTVELEGIAEIEGDEDDYEALEAVILVHPDALKDPAALGEEIAAQLIEQAEDEGWGDLLG